jgi:hypothetical protein
MEKKWNPHDRLHLHLFGNLSAWDPRDRLYLKLFGNLCAPHAMFDFPLLSISENRDLFWKQVTECQAQLVCLNNIPPSEREQFTEVMMKKGLSDSAQKSFLKPFRERGLGHV